MSKGNLIVVSAPSGAGKSSLVRNALARLDHLRYSISWTTRAPRGLEQEGQDYRFVSEDDFRRMRDQGGFLESAEVHGHLYGTPLGPIEEMLAAGEDMILDIDVQGATQIRKRLTSAVTVFVLPPARSVLEARLESRNQDAPAEIKRRLRNASSEVLQFETFDYVVINDDLGRASAALEAIIVAERHRASRMRDTALAIIGTFGGESLHARTERE
ncbi:MAG TPA: guanylate kinase [Blastocatellia bacterium]|nr:guanylate kinase [Blastocatellia bacterium]